MMLRFVKSIYKKWVDKRYLKKHNCESWEQYNHIYDPYIDHDAKNVRDYFFGYSSIVHVRWAVVSNLPSWHEFHAQPPYELTKWCKENCADDFRLDQIRGSFVNSKFVLATVSIDSDNIFRVPVEVFLAFKSEKDALLFKLYWI
jgi:hypothetical protein|tara:strand:+ start:490 stop:921 length:432 start_codon:yes stop_codon:yes gene_type:complete